MKYHIAFPQGTSPEEMLRGIQAMRDYADAQKTTQKAGKKAKKEGPATPEIVYDPAHSVGEMFDTLQADKEPKPKKNRKKNL
jgi:hypothetical protein